MENPGKILHRARQNRMLHARQVRQPEADRAPRMRSVPLPNGHANYTALMRSHDRVSSRHIPGQGGA